ncbi:ArsR/SmtB family transcription factor [Actinomadura alba]|uniref:Winged helix-turn-helix transcriptional regulator n=1 Tax=Actinomadura alba TaxID=406431 RepID=A0ABR7LSS4_9ACTN|nr:winged helix-turn-helix domain-containing protein [Actinomadura alba]MBC6467718.1 winged helix-turn-helix transcriptional regulator [Actinomadura alba]
MTEGTERSSGLADRLARLEARVDELEAVAKTPANRTGELDPEVFWALRGLRERVTDPGAVLFTGTATLPTGEEYEWQQGQGVNELLADDWSEAGAALTALAHPVRLLLLREILHGSRTTAELSEHERLGTTGQLYHHLRQLVSAGWLRTTARGQYAVPGERVVPLLTVLAATRR